ncbi:MAG: ABC transporter permease, partial [Arcobacteraceae bacterium]
MKLLFKKIFYLLIMLFIIALISFSAINLAPNSFFASGDLNPNITKESLEHLKEVYGLDKPIYIQFISWVKNIMQLDFGISFVSGAMVKDEILSRIPITLTINIISMFFIFCLSLYLG